MNNNDLMKRIEQVNPERLEGYIKAFDRMLLYSLACSIIPQEALGRTVEAWQKAVKKSIDVDSRNRTMFLETTPDGRRAKMLGEPDGEALRLKFLETMNVARDIIKTNLLKEQEEKVDDEEDEEESQEE